MLHCESWNLRLNIVGEESQRNQTTMSYNIPPGMKRPQISVLNKKIRMLGNPCICERNPGEVQCSLCGHTVIGRSQLSCAQHPNVIHLMDLTNCPNCKSDRLWERELSLKWTNSRNLNRH
ncbi:Hypothetical predicted protein [Octopus vulgaris]|uniref:Uncharacterized protein n=1 Tax=Octopus vulgaris TaxID=6645 RepID=A0AA36BHX0_OCTVU|nr:Hypothetical predicted protein [Octopus vulgaris]